MAEQDNTQAMTEHQNDVAAVKARLNTEYGLDIEAQRKAMSEQPAQRLEWRVDQLAYELNDHDKDCQRARNYREISQKMKEYRSELQTVRDRSENGQQIDGIRSDREIDEAAIKRVDQWEMKGTAEIIERYVRLMCHEIERETGQRPEVKRTQSQVRVTHRSR